MRLYSGGEILREFLSTNEIKYIFGNPGTTETTFLASLKDSKTEYILALHESSATGIAAGYALITKQPAIVNIHTYPGLANALFNMKNAYDSGIPLLVIAGQQDTRFLIHNPVLGAPNTELAKTATKYSYEVNRVDDLNIALQRCYVHAKFEPKKPVFLSIPMDIMNSETDREVSFRRTKIFDDIVPNCLDEVVQALLEVPIGKLVIIADYEVGASDAILELSHIAYQLGADIYSASFHVESVVDTLHPYYCGQLPATTSEINKTLSKYHTLVLLGEKIDTFLYTGKPSLPPGLKVIHIAQVSAQLGFDYPVDIAVCGNLKATLASLSKLIHQPNPKVKEKLQPLSIDKLREMYSSTERDPTDIILFELLNQLDRSLHIVTEGSAEDSVVQHMTAHLKFTNIHFSPRGGGLGWAMPLSVGIALATSLPSVCFVGDGGSLFSIHAIWTAARYKIPVVFICFVNHEYRILKDLWCLESGVKIDKTEFIGLDFDDPKLDLASIAQGFGASVKSCNTQNDIPGILNEALRYKGPTMIIINRKK